MIKQLIYVFLLFLTFSCAIDLNYKKEINGLKLSSSYPFGGKSNTEDSLFMYFEDELVLIRIPYETVEYNKNAIKGDSIIISDDESTIKNRTIKYFNFVYDIKFKKGIKYSSLTLDKAVTFNVDSLLRNSTFKGSDFYDTKNERLVESTMFGDTLLREKYINVFKPDESYNDTSYYYFAKGLNNINYSLSKNAEDIKKMRLMKVRLIYKGIPKNANHVGSLKKEIIVEIKKIKVDNISAIRSYFNQYKKDLEKYDLN